MKDNLPFGTEQVLALDQPAGSKHDTTVSIPNQQLTIARWPAVGATEIIACYEHHDFSACKGKRGTDPEQSGLSWRGVANAGVTALSWLVQHPDQIVRGNAIDPPTSSRTYWGHPQSAFKLHPVHAPDGFRHLTHAVIPPSARRRRP